MHKALGMMLLLVGVSSFAMAGISVPEISGQSAGSAIAFVSGALLVIRGRLKK